MDVRKHTPEKDPAKLQQLNDAANKALFELHDYIRLTEGEDSSWRSVYGARVLVGRISDNILCDWDQQRKDPNNG